MAWEKSSSDLIALFQQIVPEGPHIQQKKMFGYLCAFVNNYLFTGLFKQHMVFRLSTSDQAAFLDQPGAAAFEPMPGHKMSGFVLMGNPFSVPEHVLSDWARCALEFASHLPPKAVPKKVAKKTATKKKTAPKKVSKKKAARKTLAKKKSK
ncbi:MAG TPA: TfoX/Sxy family protein [Bryobacteraceae bacterium]|jgi:hypothetical protein